MMPYCAARARSFSRPPHPTPACSAAQRVALASLACLLGAPLYGCSEHVLGLEQGAKREPNGVFADAPRGASGAGSAGPGPPAFIIGADISWTLEDERGGARYFDQGTQKDLVAILADHGFNYVRLRTFVDPIAVGGYAVGGLEAWNDLDHTIEMAERVYRHDMRFLLNLHYSDTWADPGHQQKPLAWQALSFEALTARVYDYTRASLMALASAGASPHMVQIGNEITAGLLHPDGISYPQENWPRLATLLKAGIAAVRDTDPSIKVMLQIEKCNDNDATRWWVDSAISHGVEFDVLGQSCYVAYHGSPSEWRANFADLAQRYPQLLFVIGEYSHEKRAANDIMLELPDHRGLGSFIWEPTRWMESVFDPGPGQSYSTNALIGLYAQMASDNGM